MTDSYEPRTEAGKRLLYDWDWPTRDDLKAARLAILAIEAEARRAIEAEARADSPDLRAALRRYDLFVAAARRRNAVFLDGFGDDPDPKLRREHPETYCMADRDRAELLALIDGAAQEATDA